MITLKTTITNYKGDRVHHVARSLNDKLEISQDHVLRVPIIYIVRSYDY